MNDQPAEHVDDLPEQMQVRHDKRARLLESGHDARHQLHDDRGVDVGVHAQGDDGEVLQPAAREEVQQLQEAVLADDPLECAAVDAGDGHVREQPHDDEHPQDEEDAAADVRGAEGIEQRFEHGLLGRRVGVAGVGRSRADLFARGVI